MTSKGLFSFLFLLFWAIPFPMMLYYNDTQQFSAGSTTLISYAWLSVSVFLSLILLRNLFNFLVMGRIIAIRRLNNLMENGELRSATIVQSTPLAPDATGLTKYRLVVELQNFVGTTIRDTMDMNDNNPALHRFDEGKTIKLRVDKTLKNVPYLQYDGAHYNKPTARGYLIGSLLWLVCAAIIAGYYGYCYLREAKGANWQFLVWYHPLVLCPLLLLGIVLLLGTRKLTKNQLQHKFYGYETTAQVTNVSTTGVYYNHQPEVRFDLQYTDHNNKLNNASFKKTLDVLNANLAQQKMMDIFYLDNEPQNICLASDLNT